MSSPSSSREVWRENISPIAVPMASKQIPTIPTNKLPLSPPRRTPGSKTVTQEKRSYSPSLVQFSRQKKRSRWVLDLFSIIRSTLIAASLAGIPLGVVHARSTGSAFLYLNIFKLLFLAFSLVLSVLDLVQSHYSKLPHRVEAMLDLFLAFSFLSFFIIGVIILKWTMDAIYFILAVLHIACFFDILVRAHRITQQLRDLSTLTLRDIEANSNGSDEIVGSMPVDKSTPEMKAESKARTSIGEKRKTITETITAIRTPCAELEGSNRWTIVSEKRAEHR